MNKKMQFENTIHEARMLSIKGQYADSLKLCLPAVSLIFRYQSAINSLIDTMSSLQEEDKIYLQSTLHMYLEEADAVKSVMNGESKEMDLKQDFEQKTASFPAKDQQSQSYTFSDMGSNFMSTLSEVGRSVLFSLVPISRFEKLISATR